MFGPIDPKTLIFRKTKMWWNELHKLHMPELRASRTDFELIEIAKYMQILEEEVRHLQRRIKTPIDKMIDFQKLKTAFFREKKYSYGIPIKEKEQEKLPEEELEIAENNV